MEKEKAILTALVDELDKHSAYTAGKIERGIEENRKGLFNLRLVDAQGHTVPCERVHIRQIGHEFKFGAPLFVIDQLETDEKNVRYKERFKSLFNYAVVPLYHKDIETEPGKYRFSKDSEFIWRRPPLDTVTEFCRENDIRMKAHCLVYNSFNPRWYADISYRDINISIEEYMSAISARYKKDFWDMDVINEMFIIYKNCYVGNGARDLPVTDERDHIAKMFTWAKQYFPYTKLFWNEGPFETFGGGNYKGPRSIYYMMLREQLEKGVPIEGIGIQYHLTPTVGTSYGNIDAYRGVCNPLRLFDALECYSDFRLPISISEISVPSYSNDPECELLQAEVTKRLYQLFFSQKQVDSLVWWNFCDRMAFGEENVYHSGLLRNDLSEKPAFGVVDELIHRTWHTELETRQTEEAPIEFIGFYGDYEVTFTQGGKEYAKKVRLYRENAGYNNRHLAPREIKITI